MIRKFAAAYLVLSVLSPVALAAQAYAPRDADRWEAWPRCGHGTPCDSTTGVSRPALRIAAKVVAAAPVLSARWPSLWPAGQAFLIEMPYRGQVLVVSRRPPGREAWSARDERGRPRLRGSAWVTDARQLQARDSLGAFLRGLPRTTDIVIGSDWGMDRSVSDDAMVDLLLRSSFRLRAGSDTAFVASHRRAGRYGFHGCPFPSDSSCAAVLALEWRLLHEAAAGDGSAATQALRGFLAVRSLRLANAESPDAEPFYATLGGREGWAVAMGSAIVFRRDTNGYEGSLLRDTTTYRPGWADRWPPRDATPGEALTGELMLVVLRHRGRAPDAALPPGTTLEALLARSIELDPVSAPGEAARILDGIGLGPRSPLPAPRAGRDAAWEASGNEEVRASYFAAGLQRIGRDTVPLVLDLPVEIWSGLAGSPWLEPGDDGHFTVGDSAAEIHPSPRKVTLRVNGVTVEGRGIPTAIFRAPNGLPGGARVMLYLPDSLIAPVVRSLQYDSDDPLRYAPLHLELPGILVAIDSGVRRFFTCCGAALAPRIDQPGDLPKWIGTRYIGPPRPDTPPAIVFHLPGPPADSQLSRGIVPFGGRAAHRAPYGSVVIRFSEGATVTQRHDATALVRLRLGRGLVVSAERTALIPLRQGLTPAVVNEALRQVQAMPGVHGVESLPPD